MTLKECQQELDFLGVVYNSHPQANPPSLDAHLSPVPSGFSHEGLVYRIREIADQTGMEVISTSGDDVSLQEKRLKLP